MPRERLTSTSSTAPDVRVLKRPRQDLLLALQMFLTSKESELVTARTLANYTEFLDPFLEWLRGQGVDDVTAIEPTHVRAYLVEIGRRPGLAGRDRLSASTLHTHAKHIRVWLKWLFAEGVIPADPTARVTIPRLDKELLPVFSAADVGKILKAADTARDRALVLVMLDTGLRAAEICKIGPPS